MKLFGNENSKNAQHVAPHGEHAKPVHAASGEKSASKKALTRALIVVGVIVLVIAAVIIGYAIWEEPPDISNPGINAPSSSTVTETPEPGTEEPVETDDPNQSGEVTPDDSDEYEGALVTDRNDGVYTCLVVGRDKASNSTDTIIVAKFDTVNHSIDCVNIPRDTLINLPWSSPKKINTVYSGTINGGGNGVEGLKTHIQKILGFDVDCYVVVSVEAVEQAVNCIGGVYFDVPQRMYYTDPLQDFHVDLQPGYQLLDGDATLDVFRFRDGYAGGDIERIGVQQNLLKAVAKQMLDLGNIPNLPELIQILVNNVETDLSAANIAFFAREFLECDMDGINFHTLPYSGNWINGVSYVSILIDDWLALVNEKLNPYAEDVTVANVDILTADFYGYSFYSTTGIIAGGQDSFYCQTCGYAHGTSYCPSAEASGEVTE